MPLVCALANPSVGTRSPLWNSLVDSRVLNPLTVKVRNLFVNLSFKTMTSCRLNHNTTECSKELIIIDAKTVEVIAIDLVVSYLIRAMTKSWNKHLRFTKTNKGRNRGKKYYMLKFLWVNLFSTHEHYCSSFYFSHTSREIIVILNRIFVFFLTEKSILGFT